MKDIQIEIKKNLQGIYSRMEDAENQIGELEYRGVQRGKTVTTIA